MDNSPLEQLAEDRRLILAKLDVVMGELRAVVVYELAAGESEVSVARRAGLDRMTVREWTGKRRRRKAAE
jgi:hypothetical protein